MTWWIVATVLLACLLTFVGFVAAGNGHRDWWIGPLLGWALAVTLIGLHFFFRG
jgi:hypothetical protein